MSPSCFPRAKHNHCMSKRGVGCQILRSFTTQNMWDQGGRKGMHAGNEEFKGRREMRKINGCKIFNLHMEPVSINNSPIT